MNEKKHQAALGIVAQLVRYVPTGGSLGIFGFFIKNQDWPAVVITFPIMVIMVTRECLFQRFFTPDSKENG